MRFSVPRTRLLSLPVALLLAAPLAAQRGPHLEVAIVRATTPAPDTATLKAGMGFDVTGVFDSWVKGSVAVGIQYTSHPSSEFPDNFHLLQYYVEPRYYLMAGRIRPYVSGRLAYAHSSQISTFTDDLGIDVRGYATQSGPLFGVGAGVIAKPTPRLHVFVAAGVSRVSLGRIDFDGTPIPGSQLAGATIHIRGGVSLDFGAAQTVHLRSRP